jgi:sugar lactone lactonase YvrE
VTRPLLCLSLLLWLAPTAAAQDMPLSQILIDGEGWKKKPNLKHAPSQVRMYAGTADPKGMTPSVTVLSPDGATLFVGYPEGRAVWAFRFVKDVGVSAGAPYCPLRLSRSQDKIAVTALTVDKDGRIYAATEISVQVFDPTGRLCGVLTPAAEGTPTRLEFEGDRLTMWIGDTKYARKLNATGAK